MIDFDSLIPQARALTAGLSRDLLTRRPSPNTWSVAECLAHVAAINRKYLPLLTDAVQRARPAEAQRAIPWLERQFIAYLEPPYRIKMKAPAAFVPPADIDPEAAIADWESTNRQLQALSAQASGLDLVSVRISSPAAPIFRFTALGALAILAAHTRRHLWQAGQTLARIT